MRALRKFENLGGTDTFINATQTAKVTLAAGGKAPMLSVTTTLSGIETLARFDGTTDFAGTSGVTRTGLTGSDKTQTSLFDSADLALFSGDGSIDLLLASLGTSAVDGPGNMLLDLAEEAGATIDLTYTYLPGDNLLAAADPVPEPTSMALFGGSLALGAALRRRRWKERSLPERSPLRR